MENGIAVQVSAQKSNRKRKKEQHIQGLFYGHQWKQQARIWRDQDHPISLQPEVHETQSLQSKPKIKTIRNANSDLLHWVVKRIDNEFTFDKT